MATTNDFEALWKSAANAWAKSKVSDGADHVDAWHSDSIFSNYYQDYGLSSSSGSPQYQLNSNNVVTKGVYSQTYTNNTAAATSGSFSYTDAVTNTFSVSLTEGLTIAQTDSVNLSIDGLGASSQLAVTVNMSSTQTWTQSETITWAVNQNVPEPPNSVVTATMMIQQNTLTGSATVPFTISGSVAVGLNSPWNGHYFWFVPIGQLLHETNNIPAWLTVNPDGSVTYYANYSLNGVVSNNGYINLTGPGSMTQQLPVRAQASKLVGVTPSMARV
jgi:hypothetical protein